jgi:hypothetical protein
MLISTYGVFVVPGTVELRSPAAAPAPEGKEVIVGA